ncbi:sugar transferase [Gammaproteobacteria bacterium]|nr:sugar transferase [Gammaproteobacteria bacterium]
MLHKKLIELARNLICVIGFILILPFLFLAALGLLLEDGFPVLFVQDRIGQNKKIFKIIKVRTLKTSTPQTGTHELKPMHRLKVGVIIRKIKLDEFPQLLNVIKGDINLVGPRPGLPNQELLLEFRSGREVFNIKPGITGLAQVMGYDMSNPKKLSEVDELYVRNKSLKIDALILLATFINLPKRYLAQHFKIEDVSSIK